MKRFEMKEAVEAQDFADEGGQALHVCETTVKLGPAAGCCFSEVRRWAHLIDRDADRLAKTARRLGVRVIKIGRPGARGQHVDLCGKPLEKAMKECER